MRAMKDSGVDWIGEIPGGWNVKRLKFLFGFGKGLPITKDDLRETGCPVISYGQVHSKQNDGVSIKDELIRYVSNSYLSSNSQSLVSLGDFIFADTSEDLEGCGNCVYVDSEKSLFAGYHTIIFKTISSNCGKYLAYLFKTDQWRSQIRKRVTGVKLFSISRKILGETTVILPPIAEQERIADYLDKRCGAIDSSIELLNQQVENLTSYKQSLITEAVTHGLDPNAPMKDSGIEWIGKIPVGWKIAPLKRLLATPIADGPHVTPNFLNEGIPFVSVEAAFDGRIHLECRRGFISREDHELYCQKLRPQRNDIFIVKSGSTTGKIILIDIDEEFSVWSPLALVRCLKSHSYKFIYYSLTSKYFQSEIWTNLSMGTQPNIGMGVLENLSVPLPSLSEQQAIADYLDKKCASVDESIKQSRALIEELGEYKKSLIYEVVTGKREV